MVHTWGERAGTASSLRFGILLVVVGGLCLVASAGVAAGTSGSNDTDWDNVTVVVEPVGETQMDHARGPVSITDRYVGYHGDGKLAVYDLEAGDVEITSFGSEGPGTPIVYGESIFVRTSSGSGGELRLLNASSMTVERTFDVGNRPIVVMTNVDGRFYYKSGTTTGYFRADGTSDPVRDYRRFDDEVRWMAPVEGAGHLYVSTQQWDDSGCNAGGASGCTNPPEKETLSILDEDGDVLWEDEYGGPVHEYRVGQYMYILAGDTIRAFDLERLEYVDQHRVGTDVRPRNVHPLGGKLIVQKPSEVMVLEEGAVVERHRDAQFETTMDGEFSVLHSAGGIRVYSSPGGLLRSYSSVDSVPEQPSDGWWDRADEIDHENRIELDGRDFVINNAGEIAGAGAFDGIDDFSNPDSQDPYLNVESLVFETELDALTGENRGMEIYWQNGSMVTSVSSDDDVSLYDTATEDLQSVRLNELQRVFVYEGAPYLYRGGTLYRIENVTDAFPAPPVRTETAVDRSTPTVDENRTTSDHPLPESSTEDPAEDQRSPGFVVLLVTLSTILVYLGRVVGPSD